MGWRDQAIPDNQSAPTAPQTAPSADTPAATGWRGKAIPANAPTVTPVKPDSATAAQADLDKGGSDTAGYAFQRAMSTGTLGATDYLGAGVNAISRATGLDPNAPDLATIQRQNEEFGQAHPYIALGSDLAGYTLGAGKLGVGARVAERLGGGAIARATGYGLENAGASAASDITGSQGQDLTSASGVGDLLKRAALSGSVGAVTGAIPGTGALSKAGSPTKALEADTAAAFKPLETTHYDPSDVGNQFDAIKSSLAAKQMPSDALDNQINKVSQSIANKQKLGQSVTADDLTNFQIDINKASQGGRDIGIAKAYNDGLDQTMASTRPLYSPLSWPAAVGAQSDAARAAANKDAISNDIDNWMTQAQRNPDAARAAILKKTSAYPDFYPGDVGDMLIKAGQPPGLVSQAAHMAMTPMLDAGIGFGTDYLFGGQDMATALGSAAVTGIAGGVGRRMLAKKGRTDLLNQLKQAQYANTNPGAAKTNPSMFNKGAPGPLGPMAAYAPQAGIGVGVSNLFSRADNPDQQQQP